MNQSKILLVEDEDHIRMATQMRVRSMGYQVDTATNGRECLDYLEVQKPDLVLMDIRMPVMNGLEALDYIRVNPSLSDLPIIIVSASAGDQPAALGGGANYFVRKPYRNEILHQTISACFALRKVDGMQTSMDHCHVPSPTSLPAHSPSRPTQNSYAN